MILLWFVPANYVLPLTLSYLLKFLTNQHHVLQTVSGAQDFSLKNRPHKWHFPVCMSYLTGSNFVILSVVLPKLLTLLFLFVSRVLLRCTVVVCQFIFC